MPNNDLTANSQKYEASYQNGKYGFTVDGTFYEIGGGGMRVVKSGVVNGTQQSEVTVQLGETIPVDEYCVLLDVAGMGHNGGTSYGGMYLKTKGTTSFVIGCGASNILGSYQVITFN